MSEGLWSCNSCGLSNYSSVSNCIACFTEYVPADLEIKTQVSYNWIHLKPPPRFRYTHPQPQYCDSDALKSKFILYTPNNLDRYYSLCRYDVNKDDYIFFANYKNTFGTQLDISLSSSFYDSINEKIYVTGELEDPDWENDTPHEGLYGCFDIIKNEWTWDRNHNKYKKWTLSMGQWINNKLHLYWNGYHGIYDPETNDIIQLNDESSFMYKRAQLFDPNISQALQSSYLVLIEGNKLLLLPGDANKNKPSCYLCVVDPDGNDTEYEWKECKLKLPKLKTSYFGAGNKVIVAFECIVIIFDKYTNFVWFCDLKDLNAESQYQWIRIEFIEPLVNENEDEKYFRVGLDVVLTENYFIHFIKWYKMSEECNTYHIKMGLFQLFPQPLIYGYLRRYIDVMLPDDIRHLIYAFSL